MIFNLGLQMKGVKDTPGNWFVDYFPSKTFMKNKHLRYRAAHTLDISEGSASPIEKF